MHNVIQCHDVEIMMNQRSSNRRSFKLGVPVAQWVKHWPTDLAVPGSIPA